MKRSLETYALQLFLQLRGRNTQRPWTRLGKRQARGQRVQERSGFRCVFLFLTEQQVVHERPRLGVEDRGLCAFVVERRLVVDGDQLVNGQELFPQQQHVWRMDPADDHLLAAAGHLEGSVVFGQSLVQPDRHSTHRVVDHQVHELVEDDPEARRPRPCCRFQW